MSLVIVDRTGVISEDLRDFVERRVRFALARFGSRIVLTSVVLADTNGPRGGIDKSCRITVKLRRAKDVVVTQQDADVTACIAVAAERAGRSVARAIDRSQRFDRTEAFRGDTVPRW